jgi:uncharacterized protein (UPF0332 family)
MGLTAEEREAIVRLRMDRANETYSEVAAILIKNAMWRTAANRLYYACFYAAGALLMHDGHQAQTHGGVISLLGWHYVKTNIISEELSNVYRKLFNLRQKGDYDDWVVVEESDVAPLLAPAGNFIKTIEKLISNG